MPFVWNAYTIPVGGLLEFLELAAFGRGWEDALRPCCVWMRNAPEQGKLCLWLVSEIYDLQ